MCKSRERFYIMLIIDALRRADTAQDVCYLLTSYVETLQFYDAACQLPAGVTVLPVRGSDDITARLAGLQAMRLSQPARNFGTTHYAIPDEAINLFSEALFRLKALDISDAANFSFDRRATARLDHALNL
jgi:hypothetical protein